LDYNGSCRGKILENSIIHHVLVLLQDFGFDQFSNTSSTGVDNISATTNEKTLGSFDPPCILTTVLVPCNIP
tara:strand:- start:205 stop:420 length:216 start_codon:yes stop_codon:yes gene_type:complete